MNKNVVSAALVLTVTVLLAAMAGCQPAVAPDTNLNSAATAPAKEAFDPAAIEAEVKKLGREWMSVTQSYDQEIIRRVVADDAVLIYPDGTTANKADELRLAEQKAVNVGSWEMLDTKVHVLSADAAYITGRTIFKNATYKDPSARRPIDISGEYRFLDVYGKRNGRWQVVASNATKVANPTPAGSPQASPAASAPSPSPTKAASPTP